MVCDLRMCDLLTAHRLYSVFSVLNLSKNDDDDDIFQDKYDSNLNLLGG